MMFSSINSSLNKLEFFLSLEFFLKRFHEFLCCLDILVLPEVSLEAGEVPKPSSGLKLLDA